MNFPVPHPRPKHLIVCVHDVCPHWRHEVEAILAGLEPRVGRAVALAVIPRHGERAWDASCAPFCETIRERSGEILLHGLTHRRTGCISGLSWLTGMADEFTRLPLAEAECRIEQGVRDLEEFLGVRACGFVAPAFRPGRVTPDLLRRHGIQYLLGLAAFKDDAGRKIPLATLSWDYGRIEMLGWGGEWFGRLLALRPGAVPCIVIHPVDVARGFFRRALHHIDLLLNRGFRPILPRDLHHERERAGL